MASPGDVRSEQTENALPASFLQDIAAARRVLLDAVGEDGWEAARAGFGDPDLATE